MANFPRERGHDVVETAVTCCEGKEQLLTRRGRKGGGETKAARFDDWFEKAKYFRDKFVGEGNNVLGNYEINIRLHAVRFAKKKKETQRSSHRHYELEKLCT